MSGDSHPFDRYSQYTDLAALLEYSGLPLRRSFRVNTLKSSVEQVRGLVEADGWQLQPVPWCDDAFFVDRDDRSVPLGKHLTHLLGHIYLQEAASMLPVALLDPQPHETILDMAAAPGSKTSQIAARMKNTGLVVGNDMKPSRLKTLVAALNRLGVSNAMVTKHLGQWFGPRLPESFDRVLIDAPCTAQGTVRKDSDALQYCSLDSIGKMAKLQRELLESAIASCKVGGRIVYSTCTLAPEENEEVVDRLLNKYCDQLKLLNADDVGLPQLQQAQEESAIVSGRSDLPCFRLWPQTYDTEGFFCAVFEKTASTTTERRQWDNILSARPLRRSETEALAALVEASFGTSFLQPGEQLHAIEDQLYVAPATIAAFELPSNEYTLGLPYGRRLKDGSVRLSHDLVTARGQQAQKQMITVSAEDCDKLLSGQDIDCDPALSGDCILLCDGLPLGLGLAQQGRLKNNLDRWLIQHQR